MSRRRGFYFQKCGLRRFQSAVAKRGELSAREESLSDSGVALGVFKFGGVLVFVRLVFVVAFADLLLDFFCDAVNRRIKIAFTVFGEKVGAADAQSHGATELFFWHACVVMFERDARVNGVFIEVIQFLQPFHDMIFQGFCQRHVVRRKNKFHALRMQLNGGKIQFFREFKRYSDIRANFACI